MSPAGGGAPGLDILVVNWQDRENPQAGGAEAHLHEIFGRLAARGHRVTALVSGWPGAGSPVELDGMEVHRTGSRYTFSLAAPRYYRRHLAGRRFGVVVEDLNKVPLFTPLWTSAPVVPLVHHLFGSTAFHEAAFPVALATWLLERPVPWIFRGRTGVAVSESTREDLVDRGVPRVAIQVVPNGIDLQAFTPDPDGARFPRPTLLYLGRLKRYKRVDLVLRALAELVRDRDDPPRLLVAGKGDHREELESLAGTLDLQEHVRFLGFVSEEEKLELFRRSWVHVLTSPKEGWGIANMEAAACGTPTVASDSPGLRESVVDGRTGLLVPHGDVGRLARAVASLLDDPGRLQAMGVEARAWAEGFSWDASADAMESLLARVVASRGPG